MCSPKLHVFDLNTSHQLKQVVMPHDIAVNASTGMGGLVSLVVQAMDPVNTIVSLTYKNNRLHFFGNFLFFSYICLFPIY